MGREIDDALFSALFQDGQGFGWPLSSQINFSLPAINEGGEWEIEAKRSAIEKDEAQDNLLFKPHLMLK